jgi:RND family efflux transporter MFP subunit
MSDPRPDLREDLASLRIDRSTRADRGGRATVWTAVLVVVAAVGFSAWWYVARAGAVEVRTAAVEAQAGGAAAGAVLDASGYVTARRRATVSSKITGKVVEVNVEEGMAVREGQVLARLDDTMTRATLALAGAQLDAARRAAAEDEARLREAKLTLERRTALARDGVIGRADVDAAEAQVDALQARIAVAREQVQVAERQVELRRAELDETVVRAPFSGVAISKDAQPGEMISPVSAGGGFTRTGICTIVDMSSLEIEVDVNESYINRVRPDQPVTAVLDAYPDWRIPGHVITTVPAADRQKATVLVRIAFETLDPRILPDMGVKVSFLSEAPAESGSAAARPRLLVPRAAVRSQEGRDVVFVLRGDRVERRAVTIGAAEGDRVEVASGLDAGMRVVVEPPDGLADGARVVAR